MSERFRQAELQRRSALEEFERGRISAEDFAQTLARLSFEDEQGQWWQIVGNGAWLRYDSTTDTWQEAQPPRPLPPPPPGQVLLPPGSTPAPAPTDEEEYASPAVEEPDDSILLETGVPAAEIPGLGLPAPGAWFLELNSAIPERMHCPGCGQEAGRAQRFCGVCGRALQSLEV